MLQLIVRSRIGIAGISVLALLSAFFLGANFVNSDAAVVANNGFVPQSICGSTSKLPCVPGVMGPGGGTIFYVDADNRYPTFTYLEAAPAGWGSSGTTGFNTYQWCSDFTHRIQSSTTTWSGRRVGAGKANTKALEGACTSGIITALVDYNKNPKSKVSDWFIPSLGELILMSTNMQGLGDLLASEYWSSSEYSDAGAWAQSVGFGYQGTATKDTTFYVRPIRSF